MSGNRRGISAGQLARDYGASLNEFVTEVDALLAKLEGQNAAGAAIVRCREICAAVAAAMTAALDASTLTPEERAQLDPLLNDVLLPFWNKHCASEREAQVFINARAAHYLAQRDCASRIRTAVGIVTALIDALGISQEHRDILARTLAPPFAHRMVADIYRINDVRAKFGIELSLLLTTCALLQVSMGYETILRALRLA
jgi:hypothetical protein